MDKRGQGALEYLLIIGAALVIAIIVISVIVLTGTSTDTSASTSSAANKLDQTNCLNDCCYKSKTSDQNCETILSNYCAIPPASSDDSNTYKYENYYKECVPNFVRGGDIAKCTATISGCCYNAPTTDKNCDLIIPSVCIGPTNCADLPTQPEIDACDARYQGC
ncbi:MAG: class III signal peptide-containing protein [archaeon]|jgi:uncharacterized protein (UPF0333 family)